jgi:endoglucanase
MIRSIPRLAALASLCVCSFAFSACAARPRTPAAPTKSVPAGPARLKYGRLQVIGRNLCSSEGKPVQLRGMSTMGLQWHGEVVDDRAFLALAKDWQADVVRLALYVGEGGYASHPELKQLVWKGIELAVAHGLYVIVDWHVLTPGNPNDPVYAGARAFFDEISRKYGKYPNVLYEIMNEPNGELDWATDLKPYAEKMVATIRANDPEGIILIGSGTWSQDVNVAAQDPVMGKNLAYTFHFYAGSHGEGLRSKVRAAMDMGVAVFASEWGTSEATGDGGPYFGPAKEWLAFLDRHTIGWVNWSLRDKSESSAALKGPAALLKEGRAALLNRDSLLVPETIGPGGYAIWTAEELSASGAFVRERMRAAAMARPVAGK